MQKIKLSFVASEELEIHDTKPQAKLLSFAKLMASPKFMLAILMVLENVIPVESSPERMARWEYGRDIQYLAYKCKIAGIKLKDGTERGSSSTCPDCGHRHKPKNRNWKCPKCGFKGHRDFVGAINIYSIGFDAKISMPTRITYLRPAQLGSSSRADTRQCCLNKHSGQPSSHGASTEARQSLLRCSEARFHDRERECHLHLNRT